MSIVRVLLETIGYASGIVLAVLVVYIVFVLPGSIRRHDEAWTTEYYRRRGHGPPGLKWKECEHCDGLGVVWLKLNDDGISMEEAIIPRELRQAKNDTMYFQPPIANHADCRVCRGLGGHWVKRKQQG